MHRPPDTLRSPTGTDHRGLIDHARRQAADAESRRSAWREDSSADSSNAEWRDPAIVPDLIQGYRLLEDVHRGGQGLVLKATQTSTGRTVAVKVLGRGTFASRGERLRFEREIEILSSLSAPGIVRIIDCGVADGLSWFSMDFVDGVPLDVYARRACEGTGGRRRLIELFARVAEAVHAAHLRGVIHRDLKPRNILVDERGAPHVVDFGLAKDLSAAATESLDGGFVGSLPWAAPEQVPGSTLHPDVRTDVYALGVILHQTLTQRFPYRVIGPLHDVSAAIATTPPTPLSEEDPSLRGDLETIVLTCLQKDPARRYQSAAAFAADLRRTLAGEPIEARRDSLAYLARSWVRRHRTVAALATCAALLLVAFVITTTILWRDAAVARDRAETEVRKSAAVLAFLQDAIRAADPGQGGSIGAAPTLATFLDTARHELTLADPSRSPDIEAEIRLTLAESFDALGRFEEAKTEARRAYETRRELHGDVHMETARCLVALASFYRTGMNVAEARDLAERGIQDLEAACDGRDHPHMVKAWTQVAWVRNRNADLEGAKNAMFRALAMRERLDGPDAISTLLLRLDTVILSHESGSADEMRAITTRLAERLGDSHRNVLTAKRMLGGLLLMQGNVDEAEALYVQALDGTVATYGRTHPLTVDARIMWASIPARRGDLAGSCATLEEGLADARIAYDEPSHGLAQYLSILGGTQWQAGNDERAETLASEALSMMRTLSSDRSPDGARARVTLASLCAARGEFDQAETLAHETIALEADLRSPRIWPTAQARCVLGRIRLEEKAFAEAATLLESGFADLERSPDWAAPLRRNAAATLGDVYDAWNTVDPSAERAARARAWKERAARTGSW